ncbi:MAG: hypothetical protein QM296_09895 [Bacillota bacterium]|nr:hypothetical protein [Bacillota bacterium]
MCPGIGAGTKKLSKGREKLRWCPETGAGAKKLARAGQKRSFVPRNRAQTPISGHGWPKKAVCAPESGQEQKNLSRTINPNWRYSTAAFSFSFSFVIAKQRQTNQ